MKRPAVFLDRDGTLNREIDFVTSPDQLELLPGVVGAVHRLHGAGFSLVVVTNQSGIARGLYDEGTLARVHHRLHAELDGLPSAYLHCPHLPDAEGPYGGECPCRKPAPGLLHQARELLGVSFEGSFLVGDSARDVRMARGLPVRTVMVKSGKPWRDQLEKLRAAGAQPDWLCNDLPAAADWILEAKEVPL